MLALSYFYTYYGNLTHPYFLIICGLKNAAAFIPFIRFPYTCACHYVCVDSPRVCIVFRPVELPV